MQVHYSFKYDKCFASELINNFDVRIKILKQECTEECISEEIGIYSDSDELLDKTEDYLSNYPHIFLLNTIERKSNYIKVDLTANNCPLLNIMKKKLMNPTGKIKLERVDYKGNIHWELNVNNFNKIKSIDETLRDIYDVKNSTIKVNNGRHMNKKSEYILKEAFERGYFDVPKKIGLKELSDVTGIPQTTLDLLLRRNLRQLIQENVK